MHKRPSGTDLYTISTVILRLFPHLFFLCFKQAKLILLSQTAHAPQYMRVFTDRTHPTCFVCYCYFKTLTYLLGEVPPTTIFPSSASLKKYELRTLSRISIIWVPYINIPTLSDSHPILCPLYLQHSMKYYEILCFPIIITRLLILRRQIV